MPYKDKEVHKAYQKVYASNHYQANKEEYKARSAATNKRLRKRNAEFIQEIKSRTPCMDCGKQYPYYVMQFDHIYEKSGSVANLVRASVSISRLEREIAGCEVVCANCHAECTHSRKYDDEGMGERV
jgi:hypothetical protein